MDVTSAPIESFGKQYAHLGYEEVQLRVGSYVLYISRNKSVIADKVLQMLGQGFAENEKCIFAGDENIQEELSQALEKSGRPYDQLVKHGQLLPVSDRREFFKDDKNSLDALFSSLQILIDDTCLQGWASLRMIVDLQWLFDCGRKSKAILEKELEFFKEFTSKRNFLLFVGFLSGTQLTPKNLMEIMNTHPLILLDDNFLNRGSADLMNTDNLTGLFTQMYFLEILKKEIARCTRYNRKCSVVAFEIDDFKHINRQFGYARGDELLIQISTFLLGNIRNVDILGRIRGGEFSVLLPETDKGGAQLMAQRMIKLVSDKIYIDDYPITLSAGVAGHPEDSKIANELNEKAQAALRKAQAKGKKVISAAEESLSPS
jgi:diguanylate cyclase (GGDEF)-like protein